MKLRHPEGRTETVYHYEECLEVRNGEVETQNPIVIQYLRNLGFQEVQENEIDELQCRICLHHFPNKGLRIAHERRIHKL